MPKIKRKQRKQIEARVERKLRKGFVKTKRLKDLMERIQALESEIADLHKRLGDRSASTSTETQQGETTAEGDDLQRIKGIGAVLEEKLRSIGIHSIKQIAKWDQADIDDFSQQLSFKGRIERESWVAQAIALSSE
jgi:predicted flap endonuclease-1-like 5' DNA nuclease